MKKAVQHTQLPEDRGKAREAIQKTIKTWEEVRRLVDSNEASDWSKAIDLLHEKIPPKSDPQSRPKDIKAFFAGLSDDWKASYELSLPPADWSKGRRKDVKVATYWCDVWRNIAKETGNPVAIWKAYQIIRASELPVPEWILRYYDFVAASFGALISAPSPPEKVYAKIADALFMGAQPHKHKIIFNQFQNYEDLYLVFKIIFERQKPHVVIGKLAKKLNRNKRTVERRWKVLRRKYKFT